MHFDLTIKSNNCLLQILSRMADALDFSSPLVEDNSEVSTLLFQLTQDIFPDLATTSTQTSTPQPSSSVPTSSASSVPRNPKRRKPRFPTSQLPKRMISSEPLTVRFNHLVMTQCKNKILTDTLCISILQQLEYTTATTEDILCIRSKIRRRLRTPRRLPTIHPPQLTPDFTHPSVSPVLFRNGRLATPPPPPAP